MIIYVINKTNMGYVGQFYSIAEATSYCLGAGISSNVIYMEEITWIQQLQRYLLLWVLRESESSESAARKPWTLYPAFTVPRAGKRKLKRIIFGNLGIVLRSSYIYSCVFLMVLLFDYHLNPNYHNLYHSSQGVDYLFVL